MIRTFGDEYGGVGRVYVTESERVKLERLEVFVRTMLRDMACEGLIVRGYIDGRPSIDPLKTSREGPQVMLDDIMA